MTIPTTTTEITYGGNGVTTSFNFSFVADQTSDIQVIFIDVNGAETVLSPSQYSIVQNSIPVGGLWAIGGVVTYPLIGSPIATGTNLKIERILSLIQDVSIGNQGAFYPQVIEQALDILEMQIQQQATGLSYALRAPSTDPFPLNALPSASARANQTLGFDATGQPALNVPQPGIVFGGTFVWSSQYASLSAADAVATGLGGTLVIDKNWTLVGNTTLSSPQIIFNGTVTLGSNNLTVPAQIQANPYRQLFNLNSSGQVLFSSQAMVSPCWWGANPNGNTTPSVELATRVAFQNAVLSVDAFYGSVILIPGGHYVFDVTLAVMFRNCHWIGSPGTVRIDFDKTTVPVNASSNGIHGIFCTCDGPPANYVRSGERLAGHTIIIGNQNAGFLAALDPTTMCQGLVWSGIDIVSSNYGSSFLGTNKFLFGLQWNFVYGGTVKDSWFFGLPNDGVNAHSGWNTFLNVKAWVNGYYGGASQGDSSRNGISTDGYWDVFTPSLTTRGNQILDCDIRANAESGLNPGTDDDCLISNCVLIGNGTGIEYYGQFQATQWVANKTVNTNDVLYVPKSTGSPVGLGGNIYYYTNGGATDPSTAPTGTTLGANFLDGSATAQYVGSMADNGRIPASLVLSDLIIDGAPPPTLFVPYLGVINVPASYTGSAGAHNALDLHGSNETRYRLSDITVRNCGNGTVQNAPVFITTFNGGDIIIDGMTIENCATLGGGSTGIFSMLLSTNAYGTTANNSSRIHLDNIRFLNCTGLSSSTDGALLIKGNINSFDLQQITSSGPSGANMMQIDPVASGVTGYALENGFIADCYSDGETSNGINMLFRASAVLTNGITVSRNRLFGLNAGAANNQQGFFNLTGPGSGGVLTGALHFMDNEASYASDTNYPLRFGSMPTTSTISLYSHRNRYNRGNFKLGLSSGIQVANSLSGFLTTDVYDNGLLGELETRNSGSPASGAFWVGDRSWRTSVNASNPFLDVCTVSGGSTSGLMSGCTMSGTSGQNNVTYTGTPPAVGEVIATDGHTYFVRAVLTGSTTIYLTPVLATSPSGAAASYPSAVFKQASLGA